jgi:hypothetical protein
MIIKTLPELVKLTNQYKNPYLLCHYKGIDWKNYIKYNTNSYNSLKLSDNLFLISCIKNQTYKVKSNDFIKILCGEILLDDKKIEENFHMLYVNMSYENGYCNGHKNYNSFFHYTDYKTE